MKFKYLRVTDSTLMWGKHELTREYFVSAAQSGDALIDLEAFTYFDAEANEWKPIQGDEAAEDDDAA